MPTRRVSSTSSDGRRSTPVQGAACPRPSASDAGPGLSWAGVLSLALALALVVLAAIASSGWTNIVGESRTDLTGAEAQ
jgi:hypothetical protein